MDNQNQFKGWAKVEVMGHQSHVGMVTTEVYGQAVLFRIDTPEIPEREETLKYPEYVGGAYCPKGTIVKRPKLDAVSVLVGSASIYRMTPCTEEVAVLEAERMTNRPLMLVRLPEGMALPAPTSERNDEDDFTDEAERRMERGA